MDASEALKLWLDAGDIDDDLAVKLRATLDAHVKPQRSNVVIGILVTIGAVLIGGGLLLLIASQWGGTSPGGRLALLFGMYALSVGAAALADWRQLGITAKGLWFLSTIAVGANIFLVGQIFNLPLNFWQGTLLWLIATLVTGWASPSTAMGWLAVPLGVLTLGWASAPTANWAGQFEFIVDPGGIRPLLPLVGIGLVATAILVRHTTFAWISPASRGFGALLVALPLTLSTFHPEAFAVLFQMDLRAFHFVVIAAVIVLVGLVARDNLESPLVMAFAAVGALLLVLLPQVRDRGNFFNDGSSVSWLAPSFDNSEALFFGYNAVILALGIATILAGQHFGIRTLVNLGFAVVSVLLFALYVGRIAGALPTSMAVIIGGLLLVGGAIFMERKRREVAASVELEVAV